MASVRAFKKDEAALNRKLNAIEKKYASEVHKAEFKREAARDRAIKAFDKAWYKKLENERRIK